MRASRALAALIPLVGVVGCQRCGSTQHESDAAAQTGSLDPTRADADVVWTFPGPGQTEPPLRDPSGQAYPAERAEPHLVASDGTTFVERWFPPRIQCLDGATGRVRWEHAMPPVAAPLGGGSTPSLNDARIRLVTSQGDLVVARPQEGGTAVLIALSSTDGAVRWTLQPTADEAATQLFDTGADAFVAIVTTKPGVALAAFSSTSGAQKWRTPLGKDCPPSMGMTLDPVRMRGPRVLARTLCGEEHVLLTLLSLDTGSRAWGLRVERSTEAAFFATGELYLNGPTVYRAVDSETGAEKWRTASAVDLPHRAIPPMLVAVRRNGTRYFAVIDSADPERGGPTSYHAVDARSSRVLEVQPALPNDSDLADIRALPAQPPLSLIRDMTPLADGAAIVRDQGRGSISRVRRTPAR